MQAIFAVGDTGEFGFEGELPWDEIPEDLAHFKEKTLGKVLLCGKNTYNGLPKAVFKGRTVKMVKRMDDIFEGDHSNSIIIGGASLLTQENLSRCDTIWMTRVVGSYVADTHLDLTKLSKLLIKNRGKTLLELGKGYMIHEMHIGNTYE